MHPQPASPAVDAASPYSDRTHCVPTTPAHPLLEKCRHCCCCCCCCCCRTPPSRPPPVCSTLHSSGWQTTGRDQQRRPQAHPAPTSPQLLLSCTWMGRPAASPCLPRYGCTAGQCTSFFVSGWLHLARGQGLGQGFRMGKSTCKQGRNVDPATHVCSSAGDNVRQQQQQHLGGRSSNVPGCLSPAQKPLVDSGMPRVGRGEGWMWMCVGLWVCA